jgi:hypothetical protein
MFVYKTQKELGEMDEAAVDAYMASKKSMKMLKGPKRLKRPLRLQNKNFRKNLKPQKKRQKTPKPKPTTPLSKSVN